MTETDAYSLHEPPPQYSDLLDASTSTDATTNQLPRKGETGSAQTQLARKDDGPASSTSTSIAPPDFAEHHARVKLNALGDVVSHDGHLNKDGEALLRFITMHARSAPELWLSLRGEHDEQRTETYFRDGKSHTRHTTVTVTDFAFEVPVHTSDDADLKGRLYIVPPELPAWRSRGVLRRGGLTENAIALPSAEDLEAGIGIGDGTKPYERLRGAKMGMKARRAADGWWRKFRQRGLPLFAPLPELVHHAAMRTPYFDEDGYEHPLRAEELEALGPLGFTSICDGRLVDREAAMPGLRARNEELTRTAMRVWCDAYCAEARPLKEFEVTKQFSGWHFARIEAAVRSHIRRAPYTGRLTLSWRQTSSSIRVLPSTQLARVFSLPWPLKLLLSLIFVYPILWLLRVFFLGAKFDVIRCNYALTRWIPLRDAPAEVTTPLPEGSRRKPPAVTRLQNEQGEEEDWVLLGRTEDEWLALWRERLTSAVKTGARGPLRRLS